MVDDTDGPAPRITPRLMFGLALMVLGVVFTLDNLDLLDADRFLKFWPVFLIAIGLAKFVQPRRSDSPFSGIIWILIGALLLASNLGFMSFWKLVPLVLLIIGARIVFRALRNPYHRFRALPDNRDYIRAFSVMGGVRRGTNTPSFQGGEAGAIMGGVEIDLRNATIAGEEAVIDCFALWGGIDIYVPQDWEVVNRGYALLGGFGDETRRPSVPRGRLVITGFALMGGVEISN